VGGKAEAPAPSPVSYASTLPPAAEEAQRWGEAYPTLPPFAKAVVPALLKLLARDGADKFVTPPAEPGASEPPAPVGISFVLARLLAGRIPGRQALLAALRAALEDSEGVGLPLLQFLNFTISADEANAASAAAAARAQLAPRRFYSAARGECLPALSGWDAQAEWSKAKSGEAAERAAAIAAALAPVPLPLSHADANARSDSEEEAEDWEPEPRSQFGQPEEAAGWGLGAAIASAAHNVLSDRRPSGFRKAGAGGREAYYSRGKTGPVGGRGGGGGAKGGHKRRPDSSDDDGAPNQAEEEEEEQEPEPEPEAE